MEGALFDGQSEVCLMPDTRLHKSLQNPNCKYCIEIHALKEHLNLKKEKALKHHIHQELQERYHLNMSDPVQ